MPGMTAEQHALARKVVEMVGDSDLSPADILMALSIAQATLIASAFPNNVQDAKDVIVDTMAKHIDTALLIRGRIAR